jgi:hypothetical protein
VDVVSLRTASIANDAVPLSPHPTGYRLYTLRERKKRTIEAMAYNALVKSWSEITRLARGSSPPSET